MERTCGVIIRDLERGESDVLVEVFTSRWGRLYAVAKGGKRSKRRFLNKLEPFSYLRLLLDGPKKGLVRLDQADTVRVFVNLLGNLKKILCGFYALELVHIMTPLWDPHPEVLQLLVRFLTFLDGSSPREDHLRAFELKMLSELGYRPRLERCLGCGEPVRGEGVFSLSRGGVFHPDCAREDGIRVSEETLRRLRGVLLGERVLPFPPEVLCEARELLPAFIRYQTGREIRTLRVMQEVGIWNSSG